MSKHQETIADLTNTNFQQAYKISSLNDQVVKLKVEKYHLQVKLASQQDDVKMSVTYCNMMQNEYLSQVAENERLRELLKGYEALPNDRNPNNSTTNSFDQPEIITDYSKIKIKQEPNDEQAYKLQNTEDPFQMAIDFCNERFKEETSSLRGYDLRCYLFNSNGEKVVPQLVMNARNACNFYQNQRPTGKHNPAWTSLTEEEKAPWKEDWMRMKKIQVEQIGMGLCRYRAPPVTQPYRKRRIYTTKNNPELYYH